MEHIVPVLLRMRGAAVFEHCAGSLPMHRVGALKCEAPHDAGMRGETLPRAQGDEAFQCEVCGERTAATKHLRLHRLPRVLLLHIKRFRCTGATREKITTNVAFPLKVSKTPPCLCTHASLAWVW